MTLKPLTCPTCGAPVDDPGIGATNCRYCGSRLVSQDGPSVTVAGALLDKARGRWTYLRLALGIALLVAGVFLLRGWYFGTWGSPNTESIVGPAVMLGIAALLLAAGSTKLLAIASSALTGIALILKPILYPLRSEWMGRVSEFSYTSETHLNFVTPGVLLVILAVLISLSWKIRK